MNRKTATKTQRELLELCAKRLPEGLTIDLIWCDDAFCGVTAACEMAIERSRRTQEFPAMAMASCSSAWDALRTLARSVPNPGTCYSNLAHAATRAHSERSKHGCIFAFDNAAGFMDCSAIDLSFKGEARPSKWEKIVAAFEDAQREVGCPVRLIFFIYKTSILIRRDANGRYSGNSEMKFPRAGKRFFDRTNDWDWKRNGLAAAKSKSEFSYFETEADTRHDRIAKHA